MEGGAEEEGIGGKTGAIIKLGLWGVLELVQIGLFSLLYISLSFTWSLIDEGMHRGIQLHSARSRGLYDIFTRGIRE